MMRGITVGVGLSLLWLAAVSSPDAARNGSIRGRVEIRRAVPSTVPRASLTDGGVLKAPDFTDRLRSVVYLETAPRAAFEQIDPAHAVMDQRNETFVPHLLAITTGTTVDFPNSDRIYHNVFSLSKTKSFDLGRYAAGHSRSITFDRPGIVRVFCDIHSHMNAFILVFAHRYFAVTDAEGRYHLDNVPPGTYTVVMWNEAWPQETRQVTIPDAGGEVDVSFAPTRGGHASP